MNAMQQETVRAENFKAENLLALIDQNAEKTVVAHLGVRKSFLDEFLSEVSQQTDRLENINEGILDREFHQDLSRVVTTLRAIINNCRSDPNDINEELALASIIRDIADASDEYAHIISQQNGRALHQEALTRVATDIHNVRLPWVRALLERMTLNDEAPAAERLQLSSSFFEKR